MVDIISFLCSHLHIVSKLRASGQIPWKKQDNNLTLLLQLLGKGCPHILLCVILVVFFRFSPLSLTVPGNIRLP
jgi:hypothetical protein